MKFIGVVVSKMDRPIGAVLDSIAPHVQELIVVRGDAGVAERWDAIARFTEIRRTRKEEPFAAYVQDDDAIVDVPAVLAAYQPRVVTCNMPEDRRAEYPDAIALVGWGAVLDGNLVDAAFRRYWMYAHTHGCFEAWNDDVSRSESDRVFTGLSTLKLIDVPFDSLRAAHGADRMGRRAIHGDYMQEIRRRIHAVRGGQ